MSGSQTAAGTTIAMTASLPTTEDVAGYSALTYTTIGNVESIPAFGPSTAENTFQPLNGPKQTHKGPPDYGSLQLPMAYDSDDAGQIMLQTAAEPGDNALRAFKVTYPSGDIRYFQARVLGNPETPGSATNVIMSNANLAINTKVVRDNAGS